MSKTYKIALGILLLLLMALTYLEAMEPEPVNWNPSYSAGDKIALGTFVLFENLQDQHFEIETVNLPPYEFLNNNSPKGTYFFLNDNLAFDDDELNKLLTWVSEGNTLFIAAENFGGKLMDTVGLYTDALIPQGDLSFKPILELTDPDLKQEQPYLLDKETYLPIFRETDTVDYQTLGVSEFYTDTLKLENPRPNYVRLAFGDGEILLHSTPKAFSNFFMLHEDNAAYVERALAYLPSENTLYWDQYYKTGKSFYTSPLYILLNNRALKWAYYFALIGSLLFVIFEGKRKQRSIPVVKPLENQTYSFTRTISGLYLDRKDYKKIASKKIALFLEYIRTQLRIPTAHINEDFYPKLASGSGTSEEEVRDLFRIIQETESKERLNKEELLALNSAIDSFKNKK
ncbi:hypothetical protein GCM10007103_24510 [Salinimicrobium marinum]|uniref:DUF4350 domain-containing protein n=1 Tax=Salinimicrobium marinum TaxID=680283 RepID=A0A918SJ90_9FLAO|nr:DUF4350 domain-containing protein [Salinimicrobium marinum]GHA42293.1 hypothetical protein GCM10007103_24510 [Salinimicrobium marinum]